MNIMISGNNDLRRDLNKGGAQARELVDQLKEDFDKIFTEGLRVVANGELEKDQLPSKES